MNKTAIRNFAVWARNKLIADVSYHAGLLGITKNGIANELPQSTRDVEFYDIGTAEPYAVRGEEIAQRKSLADAIRAKEKDSDYETAYSSVIEEVAYTWFNRLIAVRFMEVNDYLPAHVRVLSSESGKQEPDIVTAPFDAELFFAEGEHQKIIQMKNDNKLDEVFRFLFIKQCRELSRILPRLFEGTNDYTELLLSLSFIDQEGVVYHLVHDITEDDFNIEKGGQVEIIGWLYQYYNTEPKNEAFAKNGKITKEEIPAVTQLFTPDWIVRYMVENSLGRLWVEGHPNDLLKSKWKYYLEEAEQEPEVQAKLEEIHKEYAKLNPEDIHFIDPCMGSGHILVYAFDVLMQIYESAGYSQRDAAKGILENNLYGLDIDDRAYQMAYFAVMMKARQYNRRILSADTACHVYSIQDSNSINGNQLIYFGTGLSEVEKKEAINQITGLLDAQEYGSILNVENYNWDLLRRFVSETNFEGQMTLDSVGLSQTQEKLDLIIDIGETMARKYEVVVTNPPYMGAAKMNNHLLDYLKKYYSEYKSDLFAAFMVKCSGMIVDNGYCGFFTPYVWMFIQSYEELRQYIFHFCTIQTLIQFEYSAFEEATVPVCTFVFKGGCNPGFLGNYIRLTDFRGGMEIQRKKTLEAMENHNCGFYYEQKTQNFDKIPGGPIAFWVSEKGLEAFDAVPFGERFISGGRNKTHNNELYVRNWWEISSSERWKPYSNGGDYRKWYGNDSYVVDWSIKARNFYASHGGLLKEKFWECEAITWNDITSGPSSYRLKPPQNAFSSVSPTIVNEDKSYDYTMLGFLNSNVCAWMNRITNPTLHTLVGNILSLPDKIEDKNTDSISKRAVEISKKDWDAFEISKDFKRHPLV